MYEKSSLESIDLSMVLKEIGRFFLIEEVTEEILVLCRILTAASSVAEFNCSISSSDEPSLGGIVVGGVRFCCVRNSVGLW